MAKKKLLVTGSCGFIFSNFVRYLQYNKSNYDIVSIDKLVQKHSLDNIYANKGHTFYVGDVADKHFVDVIFQMERPDIVVHGAAESQVDDSVGNASPFIMSNVLGTQVIVDACLKYKVEKLVQISCYDEKTRAVTRSGLKYWHELNVGDLVLSINPETGDIEEKPIQKIIIQDYNGELLFFQNDRVNLNVTPNHRIFYTDHIKEYNGELRCNAAENLQKIGGNKYLPNGATNKSSIKTINIKNVGEVDAYSLFYMCGVFIGDGFTAYQQTKCKSKTGLTKKEYYTQCRDPKTGRLISSGKMGPKDENISSCYRIFFDVPENDKARKKLEIALSKLNIKYHKHKGKAGEHVYFSSKPWAEFLDTFGKYAKNKYIPEWMFDHGTELLRALWQGIHDSDGHGFRKKRNTSITTISEKLTGQLCYLGAMLGSFPSIRTRFAKSIFEGRVIQGTANIIYFPNQHRPILPAAISNQYIGKIWCLSVKDNKNFLVERDGKTAFCGNTDECYGQLLPNDSPWTETSICAPRNPYAASKLCSELVVQAAHYTHGLQYNITRSCNNFGPRQSTKNLIPRIIQRVLDDQKMPIYGQGLQLREWISVFDKCSAILTIMEKAPPNETYNISAGWEFANIEIFHKICDIIGKGHDSIEFIKDPRGGGHDFRYAIDSSKLRSLGWKPENKFKDALEKTVSWYTNNRWFIK